ncbi:hypothetical protein QFC22_005904 [Naganishia vaughanmartiniae]|uniref:Uncharacterized protein n=1 Tax=Naganishia vaughanmartiniae TaxID=1424756 RepID=A0ACC2WQP7_9TREE|nr:hypothetical protein QFC22_005904 [Naganishia vaughanmartiniae]
MTEYTPSSDVVQQFIKADLRALISKMSFDEKASLLSGPTWWTTADIPRLGIPHLKCTDGPNGIRGSSHFNPTAATCIPCETALGATFNQDLVKQAGGLLARDAKAKGDSFLLAPTCNIQRNPMNGRAFESFSEDPHLSGMLAAAYVNGLQSNGVGATIKHFVCNDQEDKRFAVSVQVEPRPLREIYLMPFMLAQKYAKPWAFMTSYSRINGLHCSENEWLLKDLLRGEWQFNGLVMSDWFGTYSTDLAIKAGLDLEMPSPTHWRGPQLQHSVDSGKIDIKDIDDRVFGVLQAVQRAAIADAQVIQQNTKVEEYRDSSADQQLNRRLAAEAIVLLKNTARVLPLDKSKIKKIAVIGPNAKTRTVSGGGSAYLTSKYVITPLEGIQQAFQGTGVEVTYAAGCYAHKYLPMLDGWITTEDGKKGWTTDFYAESPFANQGVKPVSSYVVPSTRVRVNDQKPPGITKDQFCFISTGYIVAEEDGDHEFGISVVGRARVFVNDKLVLDNGFENKQTPGDTFYGNGTIEEVGVCALKKNERYKIVLEYSNMPEDDKLKDDNVARGVRGLMVAAVRLSCAPKLAKEDEAIRQAVELAQDADAVLCFTGSSMDWETEGADRTRFLLPGATNKLVEALLDVRPDTVICNQSGSTWAFPWVDKATTLLQSWFGGDETGNAIADVLLGRVNPAGRLPLSFPYEIEHCTGHLNWGSENGKVSYGEGLFVGYRGYEETKRDVMFAFGEGLSYTSFEWSDFQIDTRQGGSAEDLAVTVSLVIKNTGAVAGAEVVQVYVSDPESTLRRPKKELKGFTKVFVEAGESEKVVITLDKYAFSCWDDKEGSWLLEKGQFETIVAKSSRAKDEVTKLQVAVENTHYWNGL